LNDAPQEVEKKNYLRVVFLNLLISVFIIISYIYTAEGFGAISTVFIGNQEFFLHFGVTLTIFTFFSVLSGPIHGLIDGFLSEFIFQIAVYHEIYFEWCLMVGIIGLLVGLYKYKPLKYHEGIKVYYTFLLLVLITFFLSGLIMVFQALFNPGQFSLEDIILNYGFKFFFQALVSIIFLVPILLVIYDRIFATSEEQLYYMWLTHHPVSASDHTFYLKFGRTKIYFCSRCSGVIIGGILSFFITEIVEMIFQAKLSGEFALILIIFLPIPNFIDWGTQRLLLRKSTTKTRLFTGFIVGAALHIMSFTYNYYFFTMLILTLYFSVFFLLVYFGHKREMKMLRDEDYNYLSKAEVE